MELELKLELGLEVALELVRMLNLSLESALKLEPRLSRASKLQLRRQPSQPRWGTSEPDLSHLIFSAERPHSLHLAKCPSLVWSPIVACPGRVARLARLAWVPRVGDLGAVEKGADCLDSCLVVVDEELAGHRRRNH